MQAFSKQEGNNIKTLHYWKRKYRELHLPSDGVVRTKAESDKRTGFARLALSRQEQPGIITIHYSDGMRISFSSPSEVAGVKQFIPAFNKWSPLPNTITGPCNEDSVAFAFIMRALFCNLLYLNTCAPYMQWQPNVKNNSTLFYYGTTVFRKIFLSIWLLSIH